MIEFHMNILERKLILETYYYLEGIQLFHKFKGLSLVVIMIMWPFYSDTIMENYLFSKALGLQVLAC